jgi:hypothetical protein
MVPNFIESHGNFLTRWQYSKQESIRVHSEKCADTTVVSNSWTRLTVLVARLSILGVTSATTTAVDSEGGKPLAMIAISGGML